jgi:hypothetical protein
MNLFSELVDLDSNFLEIPGKIRIHLIQMVKVHGSITIHIFNDTTPDRFCIFGLPRLKPDAYYKRMYDFFS